MTVYDNLHSRMVGWLKVALPLAALAILSTLFLLADGTERATRPLSEVSQSGTGRVGGPAYAGVTAAGDAVTLAAREARPEGGGAGAASDLSGAIETPEGARVDFRAGTGAIGDGGIARLDGDVSVESSTGYALSTARVDLDLDAATATAPGPVTGTAPDGRIDAGGLRVTRRDGQALLTFTGGVKLLFEPRPVPGERP